MRNGIDSDVIDDTMVIPNYIPSPSFMCLLDYLNKSG